MREQSLARAVLRFAVPSIGVAGTHQASALMASGLASLDARQRAASGDRAMSKKTDSRLCSVCLKGIPAGTGALRQGISFVHVECANKREKTVRRKPRD